MNPQSRLALAQQLLESAQVLLAEPQVVEAKREPQEFDPLIDEMGEILGAQLGPVLSKMLDKNFPGGELAKMRGAIRVGTVAAFRKSLKMHYSSVYESRVNPDLKQAAEKSRAEKQAKREKEEPAVEEKSEVEESK